MAVPLVEYLGWLATAVFVGSYLCKGSAALKRMQMIGALMWVVYGLVIGATPVVAANLLVFSVAGWTLMRTSDVVSGQRSAVSFQKDLPDRRPLTADR